MSLYRLDYLRPNGETRPVSDPIVRGDYLTRSAAAARAFAKQTGDNTGSVIQISRISGAGRLKPTAIYSGETHRFHRPRD